MSIIKNTSPNIQRQKAPSIICPPGYSLTASRVPTLTSILYNTAPEKAIPFQKFLLRSFLQNYRHHLQKSAVEFMHK